jgi:short-subunit dehydrogenase
VCADSFACAAIDITGRREEKLASTASDHGSKVDGEIIGIPGDVTNKDDLKRIAEELKQKEGKLHILIK